MTKYMTREEWLRHAVEEIDAVVFEGDLDLLNHGYQISCGRTPGKKPTETIQPYDGEDVSLDDFFPTTIGVDFTIKDPVEMLTMLTWECIHAFFNIKGHNKQFKHLAEKYYFEKPFKQENASSYLTSMIKEVYKTLVSKYGEFPGKPIHFHPKEKKDGKKSVVIAFCPECGYEIKISRKVYDTYNGGMPTCICGCKMAPDLSDEMPPEEN